ncbi:MAG: cyclic nucleotide-binding domain-containing protein [Arenimonas sp.]
MFDAHAATSCTDDIAPLASAAPVALVTAGTPALEAMLRGLPLRRRLLKPRQHVFRAGQPRHALYLVHSGVFKTSVASEDGRERITGFRLRGDLLGLDSLDMPTHACDAVALDVGEVWELPVEQLRRAIPDFEARLTAALAGEIRRDWAWMLAVSTLNAEQRVVAFLLDLADRLAALGFSPSRMLLRMTRADLGNFLSLQLETVVRALSHLQATGLIVIDGREIRIEDDRGLRALLAPPLAKAA